MNVSVHPDSCIGSGQCALAVPEVFDQDDDGVVVLVERRPGPALHGAVLDAAQRCPVQAISVHEP